MLQNSELKTFFFFFVDNMPNVLWIWDLRKLKLCSVLVQAHAIKGKLVSIEKIYFAYNGLSIIRTTARNKIIFYRVVERFE